MQNFGQPLNRVLMGNFEYWMFLHCHHAAKLRFIKLRSDVLVKLQLLDNTRGMVCVCVCAHACTHTRAYCIRMCMHTVYACVCMRMKVSMCFWRSKKVVNLELAIHCCYWPPRSKWLVDLR